MSLGSLGGGGRLGTRQASQGRRDRVTRRDLPRLSWWEGPKQGARQTCSSCEETAERNGNSIAEFTEREKEEEEKEEGKEEEA